VGATMLSWLHDDFVHAALYPMKEHIKSLSEGPMRTKTLMFFVFGKLHFSSTMGNPLDFS
jgi:hypothetical protein